jgi:hypothetical protein
MMDRLTDRKPDIDGERPSDRMIDIAYKTDFYTRHKDRQIVLGWREILFFCCCSQWFYSVLLRIWCGLGVFEQS